MLTAGHLLNVVGRKNNELLHWEFNLVTWHQSFNGLDKFSVLSSPPPIPAGLLESCRNPQDSAGLQAKVLILVASPAKLGRAQQSLAGLDRIQTELCRIYSKLEYIMKKPSVMIFVH
jgi:hypothetical protein